jgi:hypothetical protein
MFNLISFTKVGRSPHFVLSYILAVKTAFIDWNWEGRRNTKSAIRGRGITQKGIIMKTSNLQNWNHSERNYSEKNHSERKDSELKDSERLLTPAGITQKGKNQKGKNQKDFWLELESLRKERIM